MVVSSVRRDCASGRLLDSARRIARSSVDLSVWRSVGSVMWGSVGREGSMGIVLDGADSGSKSWVRTAASFEERSTVDIVWCELKLYEIVLTGISQDIYCG